MAKHLIAREGEARDENGAVEDNFIFVEIELFRFIENGRHGDVHATDDDDVILELGDPILVEQRKRLTVDGYVAITPPSARERSPRRSQARRTSLPQRLSPC